MWHFQIAVIVLWTLEAFSTIKIKKGNIATDCILWAQPKTVSNDIMWCEYELKGKKTR